MIVAENYGHIIHVTSCHATHCSGGSTTISKLNSSFYGTIFARVAQGLPLNNINYIRLNAQNFFRNQFFSKDIFGGLLPTHVNTEGNFVSYLVIPFLQTNINIAYSRDF